MQKKKRLSLSGLSEEQRRIINAEDPPLPGDISDPEVSDSGKKVLVDEPIVEPREEPKKKSTPKPKTRTSPKPRPSQKEAVDDSNQPLVTQSFRLPANLLKGLLKASMERKLNQEKPNTQQAIIAEALGDWLKKEGFSD